MFEHLIKGHRKLFWILAALALVLDLASKDLLYTPATAVPRDIPPPVENASVTSVGVGDLNGDGTTDFFLVVQPTGSIAIYRALGGAGARVEALPTFTGLQYAEAADLTGDGGGDDLLLLGESLNWGRNLGGSGWGEPHVVAAQGVRLACTGDMDGDGDVDILTAGDGLAWYENTPDAPFARRRVLSGTLPDVQALQATDMDQDGDADILLLSGGSIVWYPNHGGQGLGSGVRLGTDEKVTAFHAADVDADGDPDLLVAAGGIRWYENVGEGRFAAGDTVTGEAPDVRCLSTGDRDADGDVDVFAVQHGKAVWYENAPRETITVIPGLLNIVPHEGNEQGAFGLGPSSPAFFVAAAGVALMVLLVLLWRVPAHRWHVHVALGLLVGGALGNLYDRLTRGSVRDFIDLHWQDWHWPTFNIADVAICIGFFIILLDSFRPAPEQEAPEDESDSQAAAVGE